MAPRIVCSMSSSQTEGRLLVLRIVLLMSNSLGEGRACGSFLPNCIYVYFLFLNINFVKNCDFLDFLV